MWNREPLRIVNNRYFAEGNKPFFWLGDTAWLMLQKLSEEELYLYMRNRAEKGVNVIQTVLVHTLPDAIKPGMKDVTDITYWEFVDKALDMAEDMGLYMGLLPSWGNHVKEGTINMENIEKYASFLGERFKARKNIIWILGGDSRGDVGMDVFCKEAQILKSYNPERLMTYHPFGRTSSSLWFHEKEWLDFNMFQSGHRRYDQASLGEWDDNAGKEVFFGEDSWKYVERDFSYEIKKPTLDGEPSYEGIPQGLHNPRNGFWEEWDVRRYAYWSVFAGAAGHTYGSNAIMQFFDTSEGKGAYGVREGWQDALHHPGLGQLEHLKNLFCSVDFINGFADDGMLLFRQKERYHRIAVFRGESYVFCYTYSGDEFMLDLSAYMDKKMDAYWMNPASGDMSYFATYSGVQKVLFSPVARKDNANDWVLILKAQIKREDA